MWCGVVCGLKLGECVAELFAKAFLTNKKKENDCVSSGKKAVASDV